METAGLADWYFTGSAGLVLQKQVVLVLFDPDLRPEFMQMFCFVFYDDSCFLVRVNSLIDSFRSTVGRRKCELTRLCCRWLRTEEDNCILLTDRAAGFQSEPLTGPRAR